MIYDSGTVGATSCMHFNHVRIRTTCITYSALSELECGPLIIVLQVLSQTLIILAYYRVIFTNSIAHP